MNPYLMAVYVSAVFLAALPLPLLVGRGAQSNKKGLYAPLILAWGISSFTLYIGLFIFTEYTKELGLY